MRLLIKLLTAKRIIIKKKLEMGWEAVVKSVLMRESKKVSFKLCKVNFLRSHVGEFRGFNSPVEFAGVVWGLCIRGGA